jgi:Chlamydia polymorphic membrane protein (Chlamydia_PMP) repeat
VPKSYLFGLLFILGTMQTTNAYSSDGDDLLLFLPAITAGANHPWKNWPPVGNASGNCPVPVEAGLEDTSQPDHIIGDGTPQSCTSETVVSTIAKGGVITFDCGAKPMVIELEETAKIFNNTGPKIVIDGKGKIALSGKMVRRILYMNTCDANQIWTTPHCQNQDHPRLTVQNLTLLGGNSSNEPTYDGGGAIWARGGRLKIVNCRFFNNSCAATGPDVGGAAIRAFSQYQNEPLHIVNSTFGGGENFGNSCSNGGGLSSIGVSYSVYNSLFSHNTAIGFGANPQRPNTPGGGSGGAIYNDGNRFDLTICGTRIESNHAREGGGAIFFVSNDRSGHLIIDSSTLTNNPSEGFETPGYPGIFYLGDGSPQIENSIIE